ncbi:unknown [Sinorhizobium phage PBC5]|uniref:hypothetical protein n=1 Tax=Sinorhizobium phage PBC5 TaxID=179237 RepID=UPI000009B6C8|nr:hypothetical protein PBC5_gp05 [Sinorhizobium phage PBC5]AAL49629.1 unknown [Sinorhizobium phage PBC5]
MFMPTVAAALRFLGLQGLVALGVLVFYEGLPLIKAIPFIGAVPVLSELAKGRVDHAFEAGALSVRLEWQERERRAAIERDRAREQAQEQIDRIEANYWAARSDDASRMADLEQSLAAERNEDADKDSNDCAHLGLSKRMRDHLAPLGR